METDALSLQELATLTGLEVRTIRSWIQAGLVQRPEKLGRNSTYPRETLTRLLAVKSMRNQFGMALSAIRMELTTADPARIAEYAASAGGPVAGSASTVPTPLLKMDSLRESPPPSSTAADYLKALRASGAYGTPVSATVQPQAEFKVAGRFLETEKSLSNKPQPPHTVASNASVESKDYAGTAEQKLQSRDSRLNTAINRLERAIGGRQPGRMAKGEVSLSIPITPDIDLRIRGPLSPEEIAGFEKIAACLRELLIGGLPNGE